MAIIKGTGIWRTYSKISIKYVPPTPVPPTAVKTAVTGVIVILPASPITVKTEQFIPNYIHTVFSLTFRKVRQWTPIDKTDAKLDHRVFF